MIELDDLEGLLLDYQRCMRNFDYANTELVGDQQWARVQSARAWDEAEFAYSGCRRAIDGWVAAGRIPPDHAKPLETLLLEMGEDSFDPSNETLWRDHHPGILKLRSLVARD